MYYKDRLYRITFEDHDLTTRFVVLKGSTVIAYLETLNSIAVPIFEVRIVGEWA